MDLRQTETTLPVDRRLSLPQQVYADIRRRIVALELLPNTPLSRAELSANYQISQTPLREALQRLSEEGLVATYPQSRTEVRRIDVAEIFEAQFLRTAIEVEVVARLALDLFDATADLHQLPVADRELLRAAALLHDIGHHIADKDHPKHGQYLLKHIRMYGFTAPEVAILSGVVRYHAGSLPKRSHRDWRALSKVDRQRVRVMAGILRIADALDRSHAQPVRSIEVEIGEAVVVRALVDEGGELERWSADERRQLLEDALGRPIRVEVVRSPLRSPDAGNEPQPVGVG